MFTLGGKVHSWTSWQSLNHNLEWLELAICMHHGDAKSPLEIMGVVLLEGLEGLEYVIDLSVGKMVDCS
jgi:hypothetical protein